MLKEHILSPGFNPKHEKHREALRNQVHDIIQKSYSKIGYGGLQPGSKKESDAIHKDISGHAMKITVRKDDDNNHHVSSVAIYKKHHGRKSIALGTDQSHRGKSDLFQTMKDDIRQKRSWAEVSGKPEEIKRSMGSPQVPSSEASKLTGKEVKIISTSHYSRKIGDHDHVKTILGYPKYEK